MDFNLEAALAELDSFQKETNDVSPLLEDYLRVIAKTGNILFSWDKLQPLLKRKMELVLTEFSKSCPPENVPSLPNTETFDFDALKVNLLDAVDTFPNAPFTIQRLCELVVNPRKYYSRTDKYMRGLEKNLLVVSTIDSIASDNPRNQPSIVNGSVSYSADASYEEVSGAANGVSMCSTPPAANGTVLENFATVFPCATRLASSPSNNVQVPTMPEGNDFTDSERSSNFEYDVNDNASDMENAESAEVLSDNITDTTTTVSEDSENIEKSLLKNSEAVDKGAKFSENDVVSDSSVASSSIELSHKLLPKDNSAVGDPELPEAQNVIATYTNDVVREEKSDILPMDTSTVDDENDCDEPSAKRIKLDTPIVDDNDGLNKDDHDEENKSPENAVGYEKEEIDEMVIRKINSHEYNQVEMNGIEETSKFQSENAVEETSVKNVDSELECENGETGEVSMENVNELEQEQMDEIGGDDVMSAESEKDEVDEPVVKNVQNISEPCGDASKMV